MNSRPRDINSLCWCICPAYTTPPGLANSTKLPTRSHDLADPISLSEFSAAMSSPCARSSAECSSIYDFIKYFDEISKCPINASNSPCLYYETSPSHGTSRTRYPLSEISSVLSITFTLGQSRNMLMEFTSVVFLKYESWFPQIRYSFLFFASACTSLSETLIVFVSSSERL